jgi:hypothetical protein
MKQFNLLIVVLFLTAAKLGAQDLNWATVPYTTGALSADFGIIGASPSAVTLQITLGSPVAGDEPVFGDGMPSKYSAVTAAAPCTPNICALRSVVFFNSPTAYVDYVFTFSPAVCGVNFSLLDIDGQLQVNDPGDLATVTADNAGIPQNVSITSLDPGSQIVTGSGTTSAEVRGNNPGTTDERARVNVAGCITTLKIRYQSQGTSGRSFSITNMNWASPGPLPVKLISFSGRKVNTRVQLNWNTENAVNLSYFGIERSSDGVTFNNVGTINATAGRSGSYSYSDATAPATGTSFYRLRQTDADGRYQYSAVVMIRSGAEKNGSLVVFPNPTNHYLSLSTGGNEVIQHLAIFDINGKRIVDKNNPSTNTIDVSTLAKGFYKIKVETATGESFSSSFVKQ